MDAAEYANIEQLEREHWYYAGKRALVRHWLRKTGALGRERTLLDCGAGTGRFAEEMAAECRVLVLDDHEESLRRLRERFSPEQVLKVSATGIPLADGAVDAITALDVLEHIEDDRGAVREMHRVLKPGGVLVATVPASMALWSDWDVALHHFRRYDRGGFTALFADRAAWEILHVNYTNGLAFPAVWAVRKWRAWRSGAVANGTRGGGANGEARNGRLATKRTEDAVPAAWLNALLRGAFVATGTTGVRLPFGVSLVLVARRR